MLCRVPTAQRLPESAAGALLLQIVFSSYPIHYRRKDVELTDRVLTVPNIMSGIRFLLAPAIGYMTVKGLFMPGLVSRHRVRD